MQRSDTVQASDVLAEYEEWDSLALLGVVSLFDMEFGLNISASELRKATTVAELMALAPIN